MLQRIRILLAAALLPAVAGGPVSAQQGAQRAPTRVPVTIALAEDVPASAPFVVLRRPDVAPHDVILLRPGAGVGELADAVRSLLTIRAVGGDTPTASAAMRMRTPQRTAARREFPWVPRVLSDLRRAEPREVAGVGTVRAVQIWLPPQARRGSAR